MLFLLGGLLGLLLGLAAGGSVRALASLRYRWPLVVVAALAVRQALLVPPLATSRSPLVPAVYLLSLAALLAWTAWHWRLIPGIWLVSAGIALNLLVVAANGGRMPASPELVRRGPPAIAEALRQGPFGQYVLAGPGTRLDWLGDWIGLPDPLGRLFPQAYSPGDVVLLLGMVATLFLATRPRGLQIGAR